MTKIKLDVEKEWRVVATSLDSAGNDDKRGGNLDLPGGSQVTWQADAGPGWVERYEVTFSGSANPNDKIWPFTGTKPNDQILKVNRGQSVTLTLAGDGQQIIKYDALAKISATAPAKPIPLDPMIIIRPGLRSIVAAGLPWAIAGAAAGALITWSILTR